MKIEAASTALFSSWYFLEQFGVLFDCGDGCLSTLQGKSRKVKHCFLSHADRDHLGGLFQFLQINGRRGLRIYYPKHCGSFVAMIAFLERFDPHSCSSVWIPLSGTESVEINSNHFVVPYRNNHVRSDKGIVKSLSFDIRTTKRKLKEEYKTLTGNQISEIRKQRNENEIFRHETRTILTYSGDTPVEFDQRYNQTEILIHESTFLAKEELGQGTREHNLHSSLDEVLKMASNLPNLKTLILTHFSSRYKKNEIQSALKVLMPTIKNGLKIEVIFPGEKFCLDSNP